MNNVVKNQTKVSEAIKQQIIAEYKAAEAAAQKAAAEAAEAAAAAAAEAEAAQKAAAAEAIKAEAKEIRNKKAESNNEALAELMPFDVAFKYAVKDINTNGVDYYLKSVQKAAFNSLQFEQLIKSINLCLKQFSNEDLTKYVADNRYTLPSKFITAIINGSCKSAKAFENSKAKALPKNEKLN